jgi:hypothetical protein
MTGRKDDYINPTADGELSWRSICSFYTDSEAALERWQNRQHEVSSRRCSYISKLVHWIGSELRDPPRFYDTGSVNIFVEEMEERVPEEQRVQTMDAVVKGTPARWWATHREDLKEWAQVVNCVKLRS